LVVVESPLSSDGGLLNFEYLAKMMKFAYHKGIETPAVVLLLSLFFVRCDKGNPAAPDSMEITQIKVTKFPEFNGSSAWDDPWIGATTTPDPYLLIFTSDTITTAHFEDEANTTLQYFFDTPIAIYRTEDQQYIQMWDKDDLDWSDSGSPDDFMNGLTFIPWQAEGDEQREQIILANDELEMTLYVRYK
jgi:hypothetical protein